jgi:hypothetical protein
MSDRFSNHSDSLIAPARRTFEVAPNDEIPLSPIPKALFVGGAGLLTLRTVDSNADVTFSVQAGQILPVRASHVRSSGTTATGVVALA